MPRPGGGRPPRERRPGRAGKGPGPTYKPSRKTGKGTQHKPGTSTGGGMCRAGRLIGAVILALIAAAFVGTTLAAVA